MKIDPKLLLFGLSDEAIKGAVVVFWRGLLFLHIAFACNYLAPFGLSGFAMAADQQATDSKLNTILQLQISERIRSLAYERCMVLGQDAKARKSNEIEDWQVRYREVSGGRYPEPAC